MKAIFPDLEGKRILITGASRGIGREIALNLAKQKAHIIFNYRKSEEEANKLKEELIQAGAVDVTALQFDINDSDSYQDKLTNFIKETGAIEGLVNNAGVSKDQLTLRIKKEDLDFVLDTNLKSTMMLTNFLSKNFLRANNVSIVHMSSVVGLMGNASQTSYAASKAGIIGYSKSYAKELASKNIRSNVICPGFIKTDMTEALSETAKEKYISQIPLGGYGSTEDVAMSCLFLLSQASRYITGEVIKVDGGLYI